MVVNKVQYGGVNNLKNYIEEIIRNYDPYVIGMMAFRYGMMQGKRAERARKKKGSVSK